jgi:hypothetical protein
MKYLLIIGFLFCIEACSNQQNNRSVSTKLPAKDTIIKHDTIYINNDSKWQEGFGLTNDPDIDTVWGKPVKFYISNPKCSPIAIDFYQGQFKPTDNNTTAALLELVTTDDDNLRPFYRWCLNKTIQVQDGALAEYTGIPAREYAEKFPNEFFAYMDADTTRKRYSDWTEAISYSGFYDMDDYRKPADIRSRLLKKMKQHCKNSDANMNEQINKFAADCFPDTEK